MRRASGGYPANRRWCSGLRAPAPFGETLEPSAGQPRRRSRPSPFEYSRKSQDSARNRLRNTRISLPKPMRAYQPVTALVRSPSAADILHEDQNLYLFTSPFQKNECPERQSRSRLRPHATVHDASDQSNDGSND